MKTLLLTLFFALFTLTVYSQKNMDDVVYLKNGSRIQGTILQIIPDSVVQIKQMGGSMWIFPMKDVSMIAKEEKIRYKATIAEGKGFQLGAETGVLIGSGETQERAPFGVHFVGSYRIIPRMAAGMGIGLEFLKNTQLPVYLDSRYYINKKFYSPYLFMQAGLLVPLDKEIYYDWNIKYKPKTGYMINPGVGVLFPMSEKTAVSIAFSYRFQEISFKQFNSYYTDYTRIERMNRFNFKVGFVLR